MVTKGQCQINRKNHVYLKSQTSRGLSVQQAQIPRSEEAAGRYPYPQHRRTEAWASVRREGHDGTSQGLVPTQAGPGCGYRLAPEKSPGPMILHPGILLSPAVLRAKALDDEIDRAFPLQGCSTGTLNASLSLASQTPSPPGERTRWAVCWSASPCLVQAGWSPLTGELFILQSCGILIHSKSRSVLNAFSKDFGTVPGAGGTAYKNSP